MVHGAGGYRRIMLLQVYGQLGYARMEHEIEEMNIVWAGTLGPWLLAGEGAPVASRGLGTVPPW